MDFRVIWSPEAMEDVAAIAEYVGRDSEFYARAVVTKIVEMSRSIERFPWAGRTVPELGDEKIRERFVYSYRVVYRVQEDRNSHCGGDPWKAPARSIQDRFEGGG